MTRELAIKILERRDSYGLPTGYNSGVVEALDMAVEALKQEPVRHGKWEKICENNFKCSECCAWYATTVFEEEIKDFRYCPNCGAKMDEV